MRGDEKKKKNKAGEKIKDLTKKGLPAKKANSVKGGAARRGPGTQTEDDVYVG